MNFSTGIPTLDMSLEEYTHKLKLVRIIAAGFIIVVAVAAVTLHVVSSGMLSLLFLPLLFVLLFLDNLPIQIGWFLVGKYDPFGQLVKQETDIRYRVGVLNTEVLLLQLTEPMSPGILQQIQEASERISSLYKLLDIYQIDLETARTIWEDRQPRIRTFAHLKETINMIFNMSGLSETAKKLRHLLTATDGLVYMLSYKLKGGSQ